MVYTPLIGFTLFMILFLGVAFMLSYFWWADRYKTPEVIAAEVMQFSEQITNALSVFAVGMLAFGIMLIFLNFSTQLHSMTTILTRFIKNRLRHLAIHSSL